MIKICILILCFFAFMTESVAQDIILNKRASLDQVYMDSYESESLLSFNDLNMEFGYVLYRSEITTEPEVTELELENVRDYAVVFAGNKLQGTLTDNRKKTTLNMAPGKYMLELYVENIGRITYGPEILDNSKGLFGSITLNGEDIKDWTMTPLNIRNCSVSDLTFDDQQSGELPCFHKGAFNLDNPGIMYLDISGWGMGEVWINGKYMGSYWEEEKQQSIQISSENLIKGENEIVIFELKNNNLKTAKISDKPVFK